MKRSKIFLGATACVLGIAAIAASKKTTQPAWYCTQPSHKGACAAYTPRCEYDNTGVLTCTPNIISVGFRTIYTTTGVENGPCSVSTNCLHPFKYRINEPL